MAQDARTGVRLWASGEQAQRVAQAAYWWAHPAIQADRDRFRLVLAARADIMRHAKEGRRNDGPHQLGGVFRGRIR